METRKDETVLKSEHIYSCKNWNHRVKLIFRFMKAIWCILIYGYARVTRNA
jgi:hypothetical protein